MLRGAVDIYIYIVPVLGRLSDGEISLCVAWGAEGQPEYVCPFPGIYPTLCREPDFLYYRALPSLSSLACMNAAMSDRLGRPRLTMGIH
jgi:hypothetical protein